MSNPPLVTNIRCYIYRSNETKSWIGVTGDLPNFKVSTMVPEDTLKLSQSLILERLSSQAMDNTNPLSSNIQVNITMTVVSEQEAKVMMYTDGLPRDLDL